MSSRSPAVPTEFVVTDAITLIRHLVTLPLESQESILRRINPADWPTGRTPPLSLPQWQAQLHRLKLQKRKRRLEVLALRRLCHCHPCRSDNRPPFPPYYVVNNISYECWLEQHEADPDMEELLAPLRNDRERAGAAIIGRKPPEPDEKRPE